MRHIFAIISVIAIMAVPLSGCLDPGGGYTYLSYPEDVTYVFTNKVVFQINEGEVDYVISIPFPLELFDGDNLNQHVTEFTISPGGALTDFHGTDRVEWTGSAAETITLEYRATVVSSTVNWQHLSKESGYIEDVDEMLNNRYPHDVDQWKIRPTAPQIKQIADSIVDRNMTVYEAARAILDFIENNIQYEAIGGGEPKDCLQTLSDGVGDCDDQSILYCSIARAAKIPAWLEFGYLFDRENGYLGPHGWLALYLPLKGGGGVKVNIDVANHNFMYRTSHHISTWEDIGDPEALRDYYNITVYSGIPPFSVHVTSGIELLDAEPSFEEVKIIIDRQDVFIPLSGGLPLLLVIVATALLVHIRRK
ncbi:MAG TPA: hypothetical protein ENN76_02840 [Euryarchaeota archaeon]|nr:hypothetical protein [Euryarchaeota archaeon]